MITSITMREAYQMLFVVISAFSVIKIHFCNTKRYWTLLFFSTLGAGALHGALMAWGGALFFMLILIIFKKNRNIPLKLKLILSSIIIGSILFYFIYNFEIFNIYLNDGLFDAVGSYQQGIINIDARANYRFTILAEGFWGFLSFIPVALVQYFFEPFPWHISISFDIIVLCENILRGWLVYLTWTNIGKLNKSDKSIVIFIALSYLFMQIIWAVGTANWGTAVRHHLPGISLLLISSFAFSSTQKKNI